MNDELKFKLQAWVDGELQSSEDDAMRRLVAQNAEAAKLVTELQMLKAAFGPGEARVIFPETREFYWSKIQRQIRRETAVRRAPDRSWAGRLLRWLAPMAGVAALVAVLLVALNQSAPPVLNQVSGTSAEIQAHTFRDPSAGINFVVLQEAPRAAVHARNDGSSFMIETE